MVNNSTKSHGFATSVKFEPLEAIVLLSANAAPVLQPTSVFILDNINEDHRNNPGTRISDLLASAGSGAVLDANNDPLGIAVVGNDVAYGAWQYSINNGQTWIAFRGWYSTARLLSADALIRFVPNQDYNGTVSAAITFRAWDGTAGVNGGAINAMQHGGETSLSTAVGSAGLTVVPVNDAPGLNPSAGFQLNNINEDHRNNSGTRISDLLASAGGGAIWDVDGDTLGIAVVGNDVTYGSWQYSVNNGQTWTAFRGWYSSARLLSADALVRFLPNQDYNGTITAAITFRAWDGTAGVNGGAINAMQHGGETSLSTAVGSAGIIVVPVNDAPVLDSTAEFHLDPIDEDDRSNSGTRISDLLASAGGGAIWDVDGDTLGIAVVGNDVTYGAWQFSINNGQTWTAFRGWYSTARLLSADSLIRFVPNQDYNGAINAAITFRAWDGTAGVNGGAINAMQHGGTTSLSTAVGSAEIVVNPVNDAPVLDNTQPLSFIVSTQEQVIGGLSIQEMLGDPDARITDPDGTGAYGIAVVATDNTSGSWQYSIDDGNTWNSFNAWHSSARLLTIDETTRLRFMPLDEGFTGNIDDMLRFRAWDGTEGENGGVANTLASNNGGTSAFSSAVQSVKLEFNPPEPLVDGAELVNSQQVNIDGVDYNVFHIVVTSTTDWTNARLEISLDQGVMYNDPMGSNTAPNPMFFSMVPTLQYDTYVQNPNGSTTSFAEEGVFEPTTLTASWFNTTSDDIGVFALAQITMSVDAVGTMQFKTYNTSAPGVASTYTFNVSPA